MIESYIRYSAFAFLILYIIYNKTFYCKYNWLNAFAFLLPFKTLIFEVGLQLQGYFVPLFLALFGQLLIRNGRKFKFPRIYSVYVVYVVLSTVFISNIIIKEWNPNIYNTFLRGEGRYIAALIKAVLFQLGVFFIIISLVTNRRRVYSLVSNYLKGLKVLVVLGILQFTTFSIFQFDIFPLGFVEGNPVSGLFRGFNNFSILRISSLGGEPKGFGASLLIGLTFLLCASKFGIKLISSQSKWIWIFISVVLLTFSSGAYMLLIILFISFAFLNIIHNRVNFNFGLKQVGIFLALALFMIVAWKPIKTIVEVRIFDRADNLLSEDVDAGIQNFLISNPEWGIFGSGTGNIHNLAHKYIENDYMRFMQSDQIFVSRYGYMKLLSENGLIGLLLFLLFFLSVYISLRPKLMYKRERLMWKYLIVLQLLFFLARSGYVETEMYFTLGLASALSIISKRQLKNMTMASAHPEISTFT